MSQARATPEMRKAFLDAWVPGEVRGDPELAQILNEAFDRAYAAMMAVAPEQE